MARISRSCPYHEKYKCENVTVDNKCEDEKLVRCPYHPIKNDIKLLGGKLYDD